MGSAAGDPRHGKSDPPGHLFGPGSAGSSKDPSLKADVLGASSRLSSPIFRPPMSTVSTPQVLSIDIRAQQGDLGRSLSLIHI
eukprot:9305570-Alexandrium_andersonii.AAC.1